MSKEQELKPVCFAIMPFRKKKVVGPTGEGAPHEIDFDALWDKAFQPALVSAGYTPIRADFDTGSVIVKDMFERLAFADLVIADVSLPNGNVYYEVGLRHVARNSGCVLLAANWSRQLFDIEQFTAVRYELKDGDVPDEEAALIRGTVGDAVKALKGSRTPWFEFISGKDTVAKEGVFRKFAERLSDFQADVRAVRMIGEKRARENKVSDLRARLPVSALEIPDVAFEMLLLLRDEIGWQATLDFANELPEATAEIPLVQEQRLLALAKLGEPEEVIARLEDFMQRYGETPERWGLKGGRYKALWRTARESRKQEGKTAPSRIEKRYLNRAIEAYSQGMELDYNQYYCSCNIAQLLLARHQPGDSERAVIVDHFVVAACERAISRDEDDEWTRPTLLGAAFRSRDLTKARELAERIQDEGFSAWKLDATLPDLEDAVGQAEGTEEGGQLADILEELAEFRKEAEE